MHPDLEPLLELQQSDACIDELLRRERLLDEQASALDAERTALEAAVRRSREAVEGVEHRRREISARMDEHRALEERHAAALAAVWKPRDSAAALTQVEITRRALAADEEEMTVMRGRLAELQHEARSREEELTALGARQAVDRESLESARRAMASELAAAQPARDAVAARISRQMLARYDRIRGRRGDGVLFSLRGAACGRCNTAVPLQRRNSMAGGRAIEVCEGCGALLYATG